MTKKNKELLKFFKNSTQSHVKKIAQSFQPLTKKITQVNISTIKQEEVLRKQLPKMKQPKNQSSCRKYSTSYRKYF